MDRTATENAYWDRINPVRRTPSKLHIATQALFRLIKEEKSYHKELQHQKQRVERLKAELAKGINVDVNSEYMIRQEVREPLFSLQIVLPPLLFFSCFPILCFLGWTFLVVTPPSTHAFCTPLPRTVWSLFLVCLSTTFVPS